MRVVEITNKEVWEDFLLGCEEKTFLQSWNWGEFQKSLGNKVWRFNINNKMAALVVKVAAKRGTFLLVPHGPVGKKEAFHIFFEKLKEIAKEEKCGFIRVNPIWAEKNEENKKIFGDLGFREAPLQMHPEASWKLDVSLSEEELLKKMRKTTRYLIRQALKNQDIELYQGRETDIKLFSDLHNKVSQRQKFVPFSLDYLKNEFSIFNKDNQAYLLFGKYKEEIIAGCFVIFWSGIGFYHHAVSLPKYAKLSIPYLLQWEAIKEAKRRGCNLYDFWGYVPPESSHPWAGPTLFKMGFGGQPHFYVKTQDFPLSKKYWLTYLFEKLRKVKRGL